MKAVANNQAANLALSRSKRKALNKAQIEQVFAVFEAANPDPKGELDYVNIFTLLVAVVLSAQATDVGVNKATKNLFLIADTPQKMLALGEEVVREHVKSIGLYKTKAKNVLLLSQKLVDEFGGIVPNTRAELESLAGVGRKTANVVLNIGFGQPTIAVDTHLFRLSNRMGLVAGKDVLEVELGLEKKIPKQYMLHAHHWLILHGRYICKAAKPLCGECLVRDLCVFEEKQM